MGTFVRAVITGFGFSLGKMLFERVKERYLPDEKHPDHVIVENASEFHKPASS